ncbi:siderophore-interacting protein [Corynebacterium liangguodongii]|uniref:Siderophore-interacting protein n=1 Tax=Corynebacterium liangguodongii TaxID=2079535 RepID=A0A2S0WC86_9CORY|nr:siderophore-interacting protein [Corynebacterium liangguodongii]AWB83381.1 siderophore-interacting protein [Corynebacterium liangguodongii]PWC00529.1 siderophore-interacting protein [Corynebacterium liangguodongii]
MSHTLLPATLTANQQLKPKLHRLTFSSPAFSRHRLTGPDEYFGLIMPKKGQEFTPFEIDGVNIRSAVSALPEEKRPELRWYTVRNFRPAEQEIDVDVVTHGDSGPGSRWIRRARPGDTVGIFTCPALWVPPTDSQLLVADASALPALRHILAYQRANAPQALSRTDVVAVVTSTDEVEGRFVAEWSRSLRNLTVVSAEETGETRVVLGTLHGAYDVHSAPRSVWVSGEGELAKAVRRLAVTGWGISPANVVWVPYWFRGKARP